MCHEKTHQKNEQVSKVEIEMAKKALTTPFNGTEGIIVAVSEYRERIWRITIVLRKSKVPHVTSKYLDRAYPRRCYEEHSSKLQLLHTLYKRSPKRKLGIIPPNISDFCRNL